MDWFESICNFMHFNNSENIGTYQGPSKFSKSIQSCPISTHTLLERKKTKWYIKLFRRLLNIAVLNWMVICCTNSGQTKIDHFKFRVELVQALLIEHASESVRKFQGHHCTDKNVLWLVERQFPEIPLTEKKGQANREVCSVLQKQQKEGDSVLVPRMWSCPMCWRMFRGIPHKVTILKFHCIFEKLRHS